MKRHLTAALLMASSTCLSLEVKPWFGEIYEFEFQAAFAYSRFSKVEGASVQLSAPLNDRDILLCLGLSPVESFDIQMEGEFGKTNDVNWAARSGAIQARYGLLDDIAGDPISLVVGLILRGATHHFLRDVSTPYAAEFNAELTCAVGKEWSEDAAWTMRTYGFAAIGQGNRGYPWTRELVVWQYNLEDAHRFTLFADGYFGFGNQQHVNVKEFSGWAKFQHQSIDLGCGYGYKFGVFGTLSATYAYRIFAHNFPEHVNFVMIEYCIPFSLF